MNYEIQQALSRKVDEYKFSSLQQDVNHLQSDNRELKRQVEELSSRVSNYNSALSLLVQHFIENDSFVEKDGFYQIRNYL